MAHCTACGADIAVYDRRCPSCGALVRKGGNDLTSERFHGAPTNRELVRARAVHLVALPGMIILALFLFEFSWSSLGMWSLLPLNLVLPLAYGLAQRESSFVWRHTVEVLNFQLLWTPAMFALIYIPMHPSLWWLGWFAVALPGIGVVLVGSGDAANARPGRYPIRIPLLR